MSAILTARGLAVSIAGQAVASGLDLDLAAGECLVVLGRNGVGKTTLLTALAGLRAPDAGALELAGRTYAALGPRGAARLRGVLPQHQGDAFPATVLETVLIGRHPHLARWQWEGPADAAIARAALAAVDMAGFAARPLHTLSGGERQRVAIAALLAQTPRLYCLDEPLAHLDLGHQVAVLDLMRQRARAEGAAVLMVLHDVNLAARYADRALLLHGDGRFDLGAAATVLDGERLTRLYGHPLRELRDAGRVWFVPETGGHG
ncbi:MAG: ABC transporter ATP-binding protein [Gallionellaceae bacterium]|nr:ABC transporter ATP-binding protein [Gallionellaceae bacterium]